MLYTPTISSRITILNHRLTTCRSLKDARQYRYHSLKSGGWEEGAMGNKEIEMESERKGERERGSERERERERGSERERERARERERKREREVKRKEAVESSLEVVEKNSIIFTSIISFYHLATFLLKVFQIALNSHYTQKSLILFPCRSKASVETQSRPRSHRA